MNKYDSLFFTYLTHRYLNATEPASNNPPNKRGNLNKVDKGIGLCIFIINFRCFGYSNLKKVFHRSFAVKLSNVVNCSELIRTGSL